MMKDSRVADCDSFWLVLEGMILEKIISLRRRMKLNNEQRGSEDAPLQCESK